MSSETGSAAVRPSTEPARVARLATGRGRAVIRLRRRETALQFVLYPMIHMAKPACYAAVTTRLKRVDVVVAEGVGGGRRRRSVLVGALTLSYTVLRFNRRAKLVGQDIDYAALSVPVVRPDVSVEEFAAGWREVPLAHRLLLCCPGPRRGQRFRVGPYCSAVGVDLRMCAVRLDSEPMVQIRTDEAAWQSAVGHPPFLGLSLGRPLADVSRRLLAAVPDALELVWDYPDRSFDQLEYLLDPVGRRRLTSYEEREQTLPYRIIAGDQPFAWHARGAQGGPWRCSTNDFLARALVFLDEFDPAAVRPEFSVAAMAARGIYKTNPDADDDAVFATLLERLGELTRYYERVWSRGLDLVVIKD